MRRTVFVVLALALSTLALPAAPAAAHDQPNRCGSDAGEGAGWWKLRAHGVGCKKARRVANKWERKCIANGPCDNPTRINRIEPGWTCRWGDSGYESVFVRCKAHKGDGIVHFYWGS